MLALSQTTGYAILVLGCLGCTPHRWVLAKDIARCVNIPRSYLSKILHVIRRAGLLRAKPGYRGGFMLNRSADQVSLAEVARVIEAAALNVCSGGMEATL